MQLFALFAGLFAIAASLFDWDWFFHNAKAVFFVDMLGRQGARRFYVALGVALVLLSFLLR